MSEPFSELGTAIMTAAHRAAGRLMGYGGIKTDPHGNLKEEDMPRYEMLYSELLYFYVHITLRLAHGQHFREAEITKLQQRIVPPIIEGTVEGPMVIGPRTRSRKSSKSIIKTWILLNLSMPLAEKYIRQAIPCRKGILFMPDWPETWSGSGMRPVSPSRYDLPSPRPIFEMLAEHTSVIA